jgi:superfamily II DNA or RNA helicase
MTWSGFQRSDCDDFLCVFKYSGMESASVAGLKMLAQIAELADRWNVTHAVRRAIATGAHSLVLNASWNSLLEPDAPIRLSGITRTPLLARYDHAQHALIWDAEIKIADVKNADWHLEAIALDNPHLRLVSTPVAVTTPTPLNINPSAATERGVRLSFSAEDMGVLNEWPVGMSTFDLARQAASFAASPGFDELISLPMLREVELYPHQLRTARTVLRRFRGRAMLCDEVGLGKTIEAGMILLELLMRKLARRVLVLTPSSLVEQWRSELTRKFGVSVVTPEDDAFKDLGDAAWATHERILASYHKVRREPYRSLVTAQEWDLVIVDEAHHFRNKNTVLWKLASALQKKYILLLTATPVQNNLDELYNLVTLLQPGLLSTAKRFQQQFVDRRDKLAPRNLDQLHSLLAEAMVRNRRSNVSVGLTRRYATTQPVSPSADERALYDDVTAFVKSHLRTQTAPQTAPHPATDEEMRKTPALFSRMALVTLQKEMGSSSLAAADTLEKLADGAKDLAINRWLQATAARARTVGNAKIAALLDLARKWDDKLVVFTQFRRTQEQIVRALAEAGERVVQFHGGMTRLEKEAAVTAFRGEARILVSTESGSEGRNLQFCHGLCNFDLPWNPMRIEQRIGRLSRIGQTQDVRVFNLLGAGTIEADILRVLEAKINLFELVVGEVEMILGNLDEEREFEDIVLDLWVSAADDAQFRIQMEALGEQMVGAKQSYLEQVAYEDKLFANKFAPE